MAAGVSHTFPPPISVSNRASHTTNPTPQRSTALKLDWTKISTSLGLKGQTASALQAFKKRNDDARRRVNLLQNQPQTVDFAHYKSTLNNTAVVDEIEQHFRSFKPKTYDVERQIKAIEAFEGQAVKSAEETKGKVDGELRDLEKTLENIETARPFEDLTVVSFSLCFGNVRVVDGGASGADVVCVFRMRLRLRSRISIRGLSNWLARGGGRCRDTRFVIFIFLEIFCLCAKMVC